jgi:hypothetical protein
VAGDATLTGSSVNFANVRAGSDVFVIGPDGVTLASATADAGDVDIRAANAGTGDITVTAITAGQDVILRAGDNLNVVNRATVGRDYDIEFFTFTGLLSSSNTLNPLFSPGRDFRVRSINTGGFNFSGETLAAPRDVLVTSVAGMTAGNVVAGRDAQLLTQNGGATALTGNITASNEVRLVSAGALSQPGGIITAPRLFASSAGGMSLDRANRVANLADLVNFGGGGLLVNDAAPAVTVGTVSGGTSFVTLNATAGSMNLTTPIAAAGDLTLTSAGALSGISARSSNGATLARGSSVNFTRDVSGATNTTVTATGGDLRLGSASAGGAAVLTATGSIVVENDVNSGGPSTLTSGGGTTFNDLTAGGEANITAGGALTFNRIAARGALNARAANVTGVSATSGADANVTATAPCGSTPQPPPATSPSPAWAWRSPPATPAARPG